MRAEGGKVVGRRGSGSAPDTGRIDEKQPPVDSRGNEKNGVNVRQRLISAVRGTLATVLLAAAIQVVNAPLAHAATATPPTGISAGAFSAQLGALSLLASGL